MKKDYVPVLVQRENKKEVWRMDVTNLSVTELIKLKEELINVPYDKTIQSLDAIIKQDIEAISPSHCINNGSYVRTYKKNKKELKMKKKIKSRRK